jgi:hypothetical protein
MHLDIKISNKMRASTTDSKWWWLHLLLDRIFNKTLRLREAEATLVMKLATLIRRWTQRQIFTAQLILFSTHTCSSNRRNQSRTSICLRLCKKRTHKFLTRKIQEVLKAVEAMAAAVVAGSLLFRNWLSGEAAAAINQIAPKIIIDELTI